MIQDIASIATAVGVLIGVGTLRQSRRQRYRQFEDLYVQRYWGLMEGLTLDALRGLGGIPHEEDERIIRAYFLLCEDQLDLRKQGWISNATWAMWGAGIREQVQRWPFETVWTRVQGEASAGTGPSFTRLRLFMNTHADPFNLGKMRRLLRELSGGPGI